MQCWQVISKLMYRAEKGINTDNNAATRAFGSTNAEWTRLVSLSTFCGCVESHDFDIPYIYIMNGVKNMVFLYHDGSL